MSRQPDKAFNALVQVTSAVVEMERGRLNTALAAIKRAWEREGGMPEDLPREIELRAQAYQNMWPMLTLTPTALATHWYRVMKEKEAPRTAQQQAIDELREDLTREQ